MVKRCRISSEYNKKFYLARKSSVLHVCSEGENGNPLGRTTGMLGQVLNPVSSRLEVEGHSKEIVGCWMDVCLIW